MRLAAILVVAAALCLCSIAVAEQVGGPSGPDQGEFRVGGEAIFRTNVDMRFTTGFDQPLKSRTFYGVLEYGVTDCLSLRGKAGLAEWENDGPPSPTPVQYGYGLAWAAGLKWRICRPEEHGTALALSGQYAEGSPDDDRRFFLLTGVKTKEWTAALTVGVPHGSARPYAGVVYSDLQITGTQGLKPPVPWRMDKRHNVGAVVGMDHDLGDSGFWNLETRFFDEEGVSGSLNITF
ncbi:MAG: hypothetical protein ACE5R4_18980 [Armatimonadota bacterium]